MGTIIYKKTSWKEGIRVVGKTVFAKVFCSGLPIHDTNN